MPKNHSSHVRLFWTTALVVATVIWVVFAYFLAPAVIAKAYRGESLTIFNHLIRGQANHPLTEYLARWNLWRARCPSVSLFSACTSCSPWWA